MYVGKILNFEIENVDLCFLLSVEILSNHLASNIKHKKRLHLDRIFRESCIVEADSASFAHLISEYGRSCRYEMHLPVMSD